MKAPDADCIIIGGGHAGCEAAAAIARAGLRVLLVCGNLDRLGYLSCNPAIGGLAKGHMVREIDSLGGCMGQWADAAGIQFRTLNTRKGPAVRATRAQMDRPSYQAAVRKTLFSLENLSFWQDEATEIIETNGEVIGVRTALGREFRTKHVLLCTGTFLEGKIHIGPVSMSGGRMGDSAAHGLSASLAGFGIRLGRLKTGTTPRILRSSIDFSTLPAQWGDEPTPFFSIFSESHPLPQLPCHITWTNERAHAVIREGFDRSPLFTGVIKGTGARYCPSIEDKVARFPDRERHQIFLEPEGLHHGEVYANGISTSLPLDVQEAMIHEIAGLENAVITRPGYAIEYDYADPQQLFPTLESKKIANLWFAGQINGTSGYEEAAAQGIWAALNIIAREKSLPPFLPGRKDAYMAVLVDDLVTLGTAEPYRMFTSRAEHRLLLREDNAEMRLSAYGRQYGLLDESQWDFLQSRRENADTLKEFLENSRVSGAWIQEDEIYAGCGGQSLAQALLRPEANLDNLRRKLAENQPVLSEGLEKRTAICDNWIRILVETDLKYAGYIRRQEQLAANAARKEAIGLPANFEYANIPGLSREVEEKLKKIRPLNLGQAARISGVTPAAIDCLEIHLRRLGLYNSLKNDF